MTPMWELRCTRDLALRLGAIAPQTIAEHRALRNLGCLLVRDPMMAWPLFWPWQASSAAEPTSSQ